MLKHKIILASGSPRRREIMNLIGSEYTVISSDKEEDMSCPVPSDLVKGLSKMKATDVFDKLLFKLNSRELDDSFSNSVIIGCDTVVAYENKILGKPHSEAQAFDMIKDFQGKKHQVYTGVCILIIENSQIAKTVNYFVETSVKVSPMTDDEIRYYISTGESMDKAGAYAIQGRFSPYIEGIEGDYYNIVGYPVNSIYKALQANNIDLF